MAGFQIPGETNRFFFTRGRKANPLRSAPVNIVGLTEFRASARLRAFTTSDTGFESGDDIRVYLETSPDGLVFTDSKINIQPALVGSGAVPDPILVHQARTSSSMTL